MTWPRNFAFRNYKAAFVHCGGAPSCIYQSEERVAEWRSLGQIMSCSNLRYETPITDDKWPSSSRNVWKIGTNPLIMTTRITLTLFQSFVLQIFWRYSFANTPSFFRWGFWWRQKNFSSVQMILSTMLDGCCRIHWQNCLLYALWESVNGWTAV